MSKHLLKSQNIKVMQYLYSYVLNFWTGVGLYVWKKIIRNFLKIGITGLNGSALYCVMTLWHNPKAEMSNRYLTFLYFSQAVERLVKEETSEQALHQPVHVHCTGNYSVTDCCLRQQGNFTFSYYYSTSILITALILAFSRRVFLPQGIYTM